VNCTSNPPESSVEPDLRLELPLPIGNPSIALIPANPPAVWKPRKLAGTFYPRYCPYCTCCTYVDVVVAVALLVEIGCRMLQALLTWFLQFECTLVYCLSICLRAIKAPISTSTFLDPPSTFHTASAIQDSRAEPIKRRSFPPSSHHSARLLFKCVKCHTSSGNKNLGCKKKANSTVRCPV